jgi:hypothetical protein
MPSVRGTHDVRLRGSIRRGIAVTFAVLIACAILGSSARADPSLMGQWHMDSISGSATPDSSGNGNDLQVVGATQVPGRWGNAFSFNGTTNALESAAKYQPKDVTVLAWVKGTSPGDYKDILSQGGDPSCSVASYALYTGAGGGLEFYIATNTTTAILSAAEPPASLWDGNWHAVAGVYDGDSVSLYVDGVEVGSPTGASGSAIDYSLPDTTFEVGDFHACSGFAFNGAIDEVRVYDRALSYAEIAELQSSSATSPPELAAETADPTSTSVSCSPSTTTVGTAVTCTATVTDTAQAASASPTGTVMFSSDYGGTFSSPGATCELIPTTTTASTCTVQYTPTVVGIGEHALTASYTSDESDLASQGATGITVSAAPPHVVLTVPTSGTAATPVTLSAAGTSGATLLDWSVNGKPVASCNAQTPDATMSLTKSSNVTLTAVGPGGSSSMTQSLTVSSLKPLPTAAYTNLFLQAVTCSGGSPTLDTTAQGGPGPGCTTELEVGIIDATGCLTELTDPSQVPSGEAAILQGMLGQFENNVALERFGFWNCTNITHCQTGGGLTFSKDRYSAVTAAIQTQGLYISKSTVRINGLDFTPLNGASIAISPGFEHVVSTDAIVKVGNVVIETGQINLDVTNHCEPSCTDTELPIASFDSSGLPLAGYFPFTGTANVSFVKTGTDFHSEIDANVQLSDLLGGATVNGVLRADNANGLQLQSFKGTIPNLGWDDIGLTDGEFDYVAPGDWLFYGNLGFGDYTLSLKPDDDHPYNGILFHNNALDHAGATFDFGDSPPEIAPGVNLNSVSASFSLNPTALRGGVTLSVVDLADVSGNVVLAFPSPAAPFQAGPTDLPGAPAAILNQRYTSGPLLGLGGKVSIVIPDIGTVPVGNGYFLYDFPSYVAVGGEVDYGFDKLVTIGGRLDGQFNVANRRFNLSGNVHGCVADVICASVDAAVSSAGVGICAGDFGGGFKWDDFPKPHLYAKVLFIGTACNINDFEEDHVFTGSLRRPMAAGQARSIVVKRGKPLPEIRLDGDSGAPNVTVTGPGGQTLTGESAGIHQAGNIIVIQSEEEDETVIGVKRDVPGTYRITLLPGPAITQSWHASVLPPVSVKGAVSGSGTRRVLRYDASHESNMQVTFSEVVHGVSSVIGSSTGGSGRISFATPAGPDERTIVASVSRNGIGIPNQQHLLVASFRGPRFVKPGRVTGLKAAWRHGVLAIRWLRALHTTSYLLTLRERRGAVIKLRTRTTSLALKTVDPTLAGNITLQPVSADGSHGAVTASSYDRLRAPTTRFRPFSELKPKKKPKKRTAKPKKHR